MGTKSRAVMIWDQVKPVAILDVLEAIRAALLRVRDDVAAKEHKHPISDVTGLPAILASAQTRVTALEADVAALKQRVGL
jgi:hypothetical protein